MPFFCTLETVSRPAASLSSRLGGTHGGRVYTRCKFGPRPGSVASALGVQSCASWQVITRSRSASPKPTRMIENRIFSFFFFCRSLLRCYIHITPPSSSLVGGSHDTTAQLKPRSKLSPLWKTRTVLPCLCVHVPSFCRHIIGPGAYF